VGRSGLGARRELGGSRRDELRALLVAGIDPVAERRLDRGKKRAQELPRKTFPEVAADYIRNHDSSWSNRKHASQWPTTLATYVYPGRRLRGRYLHDVSALGGGRRAV
jgi:hypothetical protein